MQKKDILREMKARVKAQDSGFEVLSVRRTDKGEKDIAHVSGSGSCPVFREELRRLRGRK